MSTVLRDQYTVKTKKKSVFSIEENTTSIKPGGWLSLNLHAIVLSTNCPDISIGIEESLNLSATSVLLLLKTVRVVEQWKRLPREAVKSPSLETL